MITAVIILGIGALLVGVLIAWDMYDNARYMQKQIDLLESRVYELERKQ